MHNRNPGLIKPLLLASLTLAFVASVACAQQNTAPAQEKGTDVVATVDGKNVTRSEVQAKAKDQFDAVDAQFNQCRSEYERNKHDVLQNSVEQYVQDQVIQAEAKTRGVSPDDLLKEAKADPVTDADIDKFYETNKARIGQPKEQIAPQIRLYLEQQNRAGAFEKYYDVLQKKHKIALMVEPLRAQVAAVGPAKGPQAAPVTIVEFSDFQCPFCGRIVPELDKVTEHYGDKVRLVFRQFPLSIHADAQKAAEASLCANDQGKFWALHDAMFKNQNQLKPADLVTKAADLGMNKDQFQQCLESSKYADQVKKDAQAGSVAGVSGTPTLFINGRYLSGAAPYDDIAKIVDEELSRKSGK
ncbi:MAG: thioredoxin domain-containing protein [Acidobacteriota bacterium]